MHAKESLDSVQDPARRLWDGCEFKTLALGIDCEVSDSLVLRDFGVLGPTVQHGFFSLPPINLSRQLHSPFS